MQCQGQAKPKQGLRKAAQGQARLRQASSKEKHWNSWSKPRTNAKQDIARPGDSKAKQCAQQSSLQASKQSSKPASQQASRQGNKQGRKEGNKQASKPASKKKEHIKQKSKRTKGSTSQRARAKSSKARQGKAEQSKARWNAWAWSPPGLDLQAAGSSPSAATRPSRMEGKKTRGESVAARLGLECPTCWIYGIAWLSLLCASKEGRLHNVPGTRCSPDHGWVCPEYRTYNIGGPCRLSCFFENNTRTFSKNTSRVAYVNHHGLFARSTTIWTKAAITS